MNRLLAIQRATGDFRAAERTMEQLERIGLTNAPLWYHERMSTSIGRGKFAAVLDTADGYLQDDRMAHNYPSERAIVLWRVGLVHQTTGALDSAVESYRRALQVEPYTLYVYGQLAQSLFSAHRLEEAHALSAEFEAVAPIVHDQDGVKLWRSVLTTELALGRGAAEEAVQTFADTPELPNYPAVRTLGFYTRARAYAAAGQNVEAIRAYEATLEPTAQLPWSFSFAIPTWSLFEMAQLEESAGDLAAARRHYSEYLDRWGNADPPVADAAIARESLVGLGNGR